MNQFLGRSIGFMPIVDYLNQAQPLADAAVLWTAKDIDLACTSAESTERGTVALPISASVESRS